MASAGFLILPLLALAAQSAAGTFDKGGLSGVGARAVGMGGAVAAQEGDACSPWWNPASIQARQDDELSYQYGSILGGKSLDQAVAHRGVVPELGLSYAIGWRSLASTGAFKFTETTTLIDAAMPFSDDASLLFGFGAKLYSTQLDIPGGEASGYGLDFGFLYTPPLFGKRLKLGLAALDFQSGLRWATGYNLAPAQLLQAGASWRFDELTVAEADTELVTDPQKPTRSTQGFRLGVERWFNLTRWDLKRVAALRLGYLQSSGLAASSLGGQFTAGLGLQVRGVRVDYAYLQDVSALGESHRLGATWDFNPFGGEEPKRRPTPSPTPKAEPQETPLPTPTPGPSPEETPPPAAGALGFVPDSDIFAPGGQSRRAQAGFSVGYAGRDVQSWSAAFTREGSPEALRTLKGQKLPKTLRWDGKDQRGRVVKDGTYLATLRVVLKGGRVLSQNVRITVDTRRPQIGLQAYPRVFDPQDKARPVVFSGSSSGANGIPLRWELLVETADGKRVRLLEGQGALPEKLNWDGGAERGERAPHDSLFYAVALQEMESGALARSPRVSLASEATPFKDQSAIKVTLATPHFSVGEENLALEDYRGLKDASEAVKRYGSEYLVQVLGHTDSQEAAQGPVGALELGYLRAKAVRDYLVESGGVDPARVKTAGYGDERPLGDNASEAGRAKNRRVDVILFTK